tara:strand:+ start:1713 stop:1904 length:192 start_codon:yes stop_codon:yes gene_type:complete
MATLTPQQVYETEIEAMKKTIQELESVLENSQTALIANRILLEGLEKNLQDLHKETELELVTD